MTARIADLLPEQWMHRDGCACPVCRGAGALTPTELLQRCGRAAALELRGKGYRDDRADCAADLAARVLERTAGALPQHDDARSSLTALCGAARNYRRALDRKRAHDAAQADAEADAAALSVAALAPDARLDAEADAERNRPTADDTYRAALRTAAQLGYADDTGVIALAYRAQREADGLSGDAVARELRKLDRDANARLSVKALDTRCSRARTKLADGYGHDAARFLAKLAQRTARVRWQWESAPTLRTTHSRTRTPTVQRIAPVGLDWSCADLSRSAGSRHSTAAGRLQRKLASDWRVQPDTAAPVKLKRGRKRTPKLAQRTAAQRTQARAAQLTAERAASAPTPNASGSAALRKRAAKVSPQR